MFVLQVIEIGDVNNDGHVLALKASLSYRLTSVFK